MFIDHDRTCDCQTLARAAADLFGRKEGVEDLLEVLPRNSAAVVGNLDGHVSFLEGGRDSDAAGGYVLAGLLDGVGGVDDQVEKYLVQLAEVACDLGKLGVLRLDRRAILVLAARHRECGVECMIDVGKGLLVHIRMGEFLHRANDVGDTGDSVQGAVEGLWRLRLEKIGIGGRFGRAQALQDVSGNRAQRQARNHFAVETQQAVEIAHHALQESDAVTDVLHGSIDLVRDTGREPSH